MTLTELVAYVRDLTGVYESDILPDALIKRFINEAYVEVTGTASWPFREKIDYVDLPAGAHFVPTEQGAARVQEVVVRLGEKQVSASPVVSALSLSENSVSFSESAQVVYDVQEQSIEIYPSFKEDVVVEVRYQSAPRNLTDNEAPAFRSDYHSMLAYRGAVKVLTIQADQTNRTEVYAQEFTAYLERLANEYLVSHQEGHFRISVTPDVRGR